jgi:hypothetical protein
VVGCRPTSADLSCEPRISALRSVAWVTTAQAYNVGSYRQSQTEG